MSELKTLKEIFCDRLLEERGFEQVRDELREEVINHLKHYKDTLSEGIWLKIVERKTGSYFVWEEDAVKTERDSRFIGKICFIVRFFNITEEDLK